MEVKQIGKNTYRKKSWFETHDEIFAGLIFGATIALFLIWGCI